MMRSVRSEQLKDGDVLALPMGKTATVQQPHVGRRFVSFRTEYGRTRIEVGQEVMIERNRTMPKADEIGVLGALSLSDATFLADILEGCAHNRRCRWLGEDGNSVSSHTMRAVTHEGGALWFDEDGDVRLAYVWLTSTFERWMPVRSIIDLMRKNEFVIEGGRR